MNKIQNICQSILRQLHYILLRAQRISLTFPKSTLAFFIAMLLTGGFFSGQLKMLLLIDDLIDPDFATYQQLKDLNENFIDKNNLYVIFRPQNNASLSKDALCDIQAWTQNLVKERRDLVRVLSTFGVRKAVHQDQKLNFEPLLKFDCSNRSLDESQNIQNGFTELALSPWAQVLTSLKADDVLVSIFIADTLKDSRTGSFDTNIVQELMNDFEQQVQIKHPEIKPLWSGVSTFQYFLKKGYDQTGLLNILTAVVILILFRIIFQTWLSGFLFLLSYLFALIPTYGAMAYFNAPIDVLTNSLALMVLIASIEDFLFIAYLQSIEKKSWRNPFRRLLVPGFFTSLTTAIGFLSLASADFSVIRRFGVWAGFAAMLEFATVFFLLPAILTIFPKLRPFTGGNIKNRFTKIEALKEKNLPVWLGIAAVILILVGPIGASHLLVSDAPERIFSSSHVVRTTVQEVERSRGWQTEVSLIFHQHAAKESNQKSLDQISKIPIVKAIENPYRIQEYVKGDTGTSIARTLDTLWSLTSVSKRLVNPNNDESRAILYLNKTDIVEINKFRDQVEKICQGQCHLAGTLVSYGEFGERVLSTLMSSLGLSLVLVSIVLSFLILALKKEGFLPLILSAVWGPLALLALFVILRIPIFYVTSIFASILVGLAGDNTIQYLFSSSKGTYSDGIKKLGSASILLTLTMCGLSCVLFGSMFEPMKILGALMIAGFIFALIGDLWLLKSFSQIFSKQGVLPNFIRKIFQK